MIFRATTSAASLGAGALTLSGGTLQLANDAGLNFARNTTVTANTTITSDRLNAAGTSTTHTLGTLAIGAQTLSVTRGANITGTLIGGLTFGTTTLSGASIFDPQASTTLTLGTIHGGANGITKTGGGTLVLGGASTHTGDTTVSSGILQLNNNNAAGNGAIIISSGAAVANRVLINGGVSVANPISFGNTVSVAGVGVIQQTGTGQATVTGPVTITGSPSAGGHFVGGTAVGNELVLAGAISSTVNLSHRAGRFIYKGGGNVTALNPTLTVTDTAIIGATNGMPTMLTPFLGGSGNAGLDLNGFDQTLGGLILGNAGLNYVGTVNVGVKTLTLNGNVTTQTPGGVTAAHTINASGGTLALGAPARTFTVSDSLAADDLAINGGTVSGAGGIIKEGSGTLALNTVAIAGPLTINNGALQTGTSALGGTFSSGSLAFSANPITLKMKLGIGGDLITTGTLTTAGVGRTAVNLSQIGGALPLGNKTLISYTGAGPGVAGFTLGALPGRVVGTLTDTGSAIALNVTANDEVVWDGTNSPSWSEGATGNWKLLSNNSANDYLAGDVVNFRNAPTNTQIDIAVNVAPSHVRFSNTIAGATDYLVTGNAGITGPTNLVKTGDGKVTLVNPNTYTGATTVNDGTLELDHDAPTNVVLSATSGVSVANIATLKLTRDDGVFTFNRNISGAGIVEINPHSIGAGTGAHALTLSGNNTGFTGLMTLAIPMTGTYRLTNVAPTALSGATIDVQSGAQIFTATNQTYTNNIFIANGTGGLVNQTGGALNVLGQLRVGHFGTLSATYNMSGGSITLTGASPTLTPSTAGAGAASSTGDNNINALATPTIHGGGIYLGIDGTGIFNHTGGTVTTNWIVLDNRGDTVAGTNMADGIDRYTINGAGAALNLRSTYGLIARNTSTAVVFGNGTVRVDNTGTGTGTGANLNIPLDATIDTLAGTTTNLDTNGAGNAFTLNKDVRGTGTLNLIGGGAINFTTTGVQNIAANISGTANLVKHGNGTTTLAGNGAGYTSAVTVSAGRLNVPNTFPAGSITVADGNALGGEPTVGAATFGSAIRADLYFDPNTAGALTAGTLTLPNGTGSNLAFSTVPTGAGPWTAVNYTTKVGTGFFGVLGSGGFRVAPVVTDTGSSITVNVTGTKALTRSGPGATWDTNASTNWLDTTPAADKFFTGDTVTFVDGGAPIAVAVTAVGVTPWKATVNSTTSNFSFATSGSGIGGPGSLEKFGSSTLTFSGPNTYSGQTIVGGGTLSTSTATSLGDAGPTNNIAINGGGRLSFTSTAAHDLGVNRSIAIGAGGGSISHNSTTATAITIPGNITGSDALSFHSNVAGAGTFILTGNDSGYTGAISVDAQTTGITVLRIATAGAAPGGGSITLNYPASGATGNATTLDLPGTTLPAGVTLNMTSFLNGAISQRSQVTSSGNAFIHGPITASGSSIVQFNPASGNLTLNGPVTACGGGFNAANSVFFVRGVGNGVVNNTVTLPGAQLSKTDTGSWSINSNGNDWLTTGVLVGTLRMGVVGVLPAASNLILGQNDGNAAVLDLNGFNQSSASLVSNPTTPGANTVGKSITSATPATLTINQATTTTYASLITGEVSVEKSGTGKLTLLGANSHNGLTTVSNGVLNIQHRTALGSITSGTSVANGATLEVQGNLVIPAEPLSLNGVGAGGGALVNVSGAITGAGSLEKTGTGKLALKANNGTLDIPTLTVSGGKLDLRSALGTGTSTINATAEVNIGVSETIAALNIGNGGVVNVGALPPPSPGQAPDALAAEFQTSELTGAATQAVPEPGSAALLLGGLATLLGFRRRR